ncbi:MAG TPA: DsbA family protein [Thermoleophilaceae bacterium]|jgi:predicted DsbA family dithiol-disulfide isomerase
MAVRVQYFTDPSCAWSWSAEPTLRRLMVEFGNSLSWTYVMGGLARDFTASKDGGEKAYRWLLTHWLDVSEQGGMPIDARLWSEAPIASSYPACMAMKAAAEQSDDGGYRYLRALREGLLCFRRKLDNAEALVEEARGAGLDAQRFRIDLGSHAIVEAFGADLELARDIPDDARERGGVAKAAGPERVTFPTFAFHAEDGSVRRVYGIRPYEEYREAALAAGAEPSGDDPPGALDAVRRFGRMAAREVEEVCDLPPTRAHAELWGLASDLRLKPIKVLTGHLWEGA